jgi:multiple sugar transport system permease protein
MDGRAGLSGFFVQSRWWIKILSVLFILPWAVPSSRPSCRCASCSTPSGASSTAVDLQAHRPGRPQLAERPDAGAELLDADAHLEEPAVLDADPAGRPLAIPGEQYEAASVDGATRWQKFRFITWPAMKSLYLTSTILSMIWTLGDFNSVYLLTGGGPADLTHVLATLGIRYLRLDQVDLAMASIVVALPLVLPLVYFMMKRLSK